jgi:hypothetical protein
MFSAIKAKLAKEMDAPVWHALRGQLLAPGLLVNE